MRKTKVVIILIVIIESSSQISKLTRKCKVGCGNTYKLDFTAPTLKFSSPEQIPFKVTIFPRSVKIYYLTRQRYVWHAFHKINVDTDIDKHENVLPDEEEANEWKNREMCKIGHVCGPDECWGDDASRCFSQEPTHWVEEKTKQFFGYQKSVMWRHACIMDWQCKISEQQRTLYPNFDGTYRIRVDQNYITIERNKMYYKMDGYIVLVGEKVSSISKKKDLSCIKNDGSFYCRDMLVAGSIYVVVDKEKPCASWASKVYCVNDGKSLIGEPTNDAILSDLVQVSSALRVITKDINYNTYQTQISLDHIKKDLYSIIKSLIPSNPHIFSDVLKTPSYSRIINKNIIEVCPCDPLPNCNTRKEHYHNFNYCPNTTSPEEITLFGDEASFISMDDEKFNFQGADINPVLDEMEKQFYSEHVLANSMKKEEPPSLWDYGFFGAIISFLKEWSGLLALSIIIIKRAFGN